MFTNKDDNSSHLGFSLFLLCVLEFFRVDSIKGHLIKSPLSKRFLQKNTITFPPPPPTLVQDGCKKQQWV